MSQTDILNRLGQWVLRTDPNFEAREYQLYKPDDASKEYAVAKYYQSLMDIGVQFRPILKVHTVEESVCTSCEG